MKFLGLVTFPMCLCAAETSTTLFTGKDVDLRVQVGKDFIQEQNEVKEKEFLLPQGTATSITLLRGKEKGKINPPDRFDKAATARWLVHNTNWCSVSTINSRYETFKGMPFGNIASFSDGTKNNSTGTIYMLHSNLDATMIDIKVNPTVCLSISEMQTGYCERQSIDAEDPRCARLSITGQLVQIPNENVDEVQVAKAALFDKHPAMKDWYSSGHNSEPSGHDFNLWKLQIEQIWLVDYYGGAAIIDSVAWKRGTDDEGRTLRPTYMNDSTWSHELDFRVKGTIFTSEKKPFNVTIKYMWLIGTFCIGITIGVSISLGKDKRGDCGQLNSVFGF